MTMNVTEGEFARRFARGGRGSLPESYRMSKQSSHTSQMPSVFHRRAREILTAFLFTFMAARIIVFLILSRRIPDVYLHLGGTHVHHLNYGIFLLAGVGAYLLLGRPMGKGLRWATALYGIGLALTFDEFGMWLHLGGSYWQRASFDAVVVIAAFFSLVVVAPRLSRFRPHHWFTAGTLLLATVIFGIMFADSFKYAHRILFRIETLEEGPPAPQ
jgi:hypothetical protein